MTAAYFQVYRKPPFMYFFNKIKKYWILFYILQIYQIPTNVLTWYKHPTTKYIIHKKKKNSRR